MRTLCLGSHKWRATLSATSSPRCVWARHRTTVGGGHVVTPCAAAQNDLEFFRLRGRELELLCAPSADFLVVVLQVRRGVSVARFLSYSSAAPLALSSHHPSLPLQRWRPAGSGAGAAAGGATGAGGGEGGHADGAAGGAAGGGAAK